MKHRIEVPWAALLLSLSPLLWAAELPVEGEDASGRLTSSFVKLDQAQQEALGQAICGKPLEELEEGGVGCAVCPSYTAEPSQTDGLSVNNLIYGHFSASGADELLIDTDGCESHAEGFGGGLLLLRVGQRGWRRELYQSSIRLDDCLVFPGTGRDRLVCNEHYSGQGTVLGIISEMRVTLQGIERHQLLRWADNLSSDSRDLVSVLPQTLTAVDVSGDGRADLRVQMEELHATLPPGVSDLEQAREAGVPVPLTRTETFDFIQRDEGFVLVPGQRAALLALDRLVQRLME
jgi:hypothetical protein